MSKILSTQNAQITTAVVTVETITITGRQVTQSVFKQLYEERLYIRAQRQGTPWGIVNFCPTTACKALDREIVNCGPLPAHFHVVWQKGGTLRRTTIWEQRPYDVGGGWGPARPGEVMPSLIFDELKELPHLFIAV